MSKKLNTLLESEINRFNAIIAYQDKMAIDEVSYRFYNEAEEVAPTEEPIDAAPVDAAVDATAEVPAEEPMATEPTDVATDAPVEEPAPAEDVTEVDVTELVNSTNDIKSKIEGLAGGIEKINDIMGKVSEIETNLTKMDDLIGKMESLAKQVELMRPPTEEERRKALTQDSYPFNISIDDYNKGTGAKTQTDLENSSKMSMFDTIMNDYSDIEVKKSFNIPTENPFNRL
jgi:TolA-binding protein